MYKLKIHQLVIVHLMYKLKRNQQGYLMIKLKRNQLVHLIYKLKKSTSSSYSKL